MVLAAFGACQELEEPRSKGPTTSEQHRTLLDAAGMCIASEVTKTRDAITALKAAVDAAGSDPTQQKQDAARAAWLLAMDGWQVLELMQIGPAAPAGTPGGKGLRDEIYSWPVTSRCLVEQTIVNQAYAGPDFSGTLVSQRGLDALEYLLFYAGADNACTASNVINSSGSWAALSPQELSTRKLAYAGATAGLLEQTFGTLAAGWADGGFQTALSSAGEAGSPYPSTLAAVNALSDALFYIHDNVKDAKVGRPLGIVDCTTPTCPEAIESKYALVSKRHVKNNLVGAGKILVGCGANFEGPGFDDLLEAMEAGDLAKRLREAHAGTIVAADAIEEDDLGEALTTDIASVQALHVAIKKLTDLLKLELVVVLQLTLPQNVAGDND